MNGLIGADLDDRQAAGARAAMMSQAFRSNPAALYESFTRRSPSVNRNLLPLPGTEQHHILP